MDLNRVCLETKRGWVLDFLVLNCHIFNSLLYWTGQINGWDLWGDAKRLNDKKTALEE